MIKSEPTKFWCAACESAENVTKYKFIKSVVGQDFTSMTTSISLCLKCRKEMAKLLKED